MSELNREQIRTALSCRSNNIVGCMNDECLYFPRGCGRALYSDALALITELTEENERLRAELASRPPKLIITKVNKEDTDAHQMEQTE